MSRSQLPVAIGGLLVVIALGGLLAFQQFLAGDSVPVLTLAPTGGPVAPATSAPTSAPATTPVAADPTAEGVSGK